MSYHNQVTFHCDSCETHFTIDEKNMELPPGWLGLQMIVADIEGCIPDHERETYSHFCSQKCVSDFVSGDEMRRRICMADSPEPIDNDDEEDSL